jgi:hypothetical protein
MKASAHIYIYNFLTQSLLFSFITHLLLLLFTRIYKVGVFWTPPRYYSVYCRQCKDIGRFGTESRQHHGNNVVNHIEQPVYVYSRFKGTVQPELRGVKIGINRTAMKICVAGKCRLSCPKGHHHERSINILGGSSTF